MFTQLKSLGRREELLCSSLDKGGALNSWEKGGARNSWEKGKGHKHILTHHVIVSNGMYC